MSDTVRRAIAGEVRAALARHQKTQREVGAVLGMSQPVLQIRLAGRRSFRAEEIAALAEWLGEPVDRLIPISRAAA